MSNLLVDERAVENEGGANLRIRGLMPGWSLKRTWREKLGTGYVTAKSITETYMSQYVK